MQEFVMVKGERLEGESSPNYRIKALRPESKDFRDESEWVEFTACWLKVSGVGFSANAFEFSQHNRTIEIHQDIDGGSLRIDLGE